MFASKKLNFFEGFKSAKPSGKAKIMQNVILMYVNVMQDVMQNVILIDVRSEPLFTIRFLSGILMNNVLQLLHFLFQGSYFLMILPLKTFQERDKKKKTL